MLVRSDSHSEARCGCGQLSDNKPHWHYRQGGFALADELGVYVAPHTRGLGRSGRDKRNTATSGQAVMQLSGQAAERSQVPFAGAVCLSIGSESSAKQFVPIAGGSRTNETW